jgi:hypothetical protein
MRAALLFVVIATGTAVAGPKATITKRMDCASVGNDAKIEKCVLCTTDFGTFKTANASCTFAEPKTGGKLKLERSECFGFSQKDIKDCDDCIRSGGVYSYDKGDAICSGRSVSATAPPIVDAAGCKNPDVVHPLRAKRCTECVKTGIAEFIPSGDDAGTCMNDPLKFAAKFKLPEQSESVGFYAGCPSSGDIKADIACRACQRKQDVFVGGKCIKAAQAAKLAAKVAHVDVPPPDVVVANGDMEITETSTKQKKLVAQTWMPHTYMTNGDITFGEDAAHGGKVGAKLANRAGIVTYRRAVPDTKYRLTYWVKAVDAEPADNLNVFIAVGGNSHNARAKATAEWSEQTYDFTTPKSGAATFPLALTFSASPKPNGKDGAFLVDDVKLVKAPADATPTTTSAPPADAQGSAAPATGSGSATP